jgi:hypothetical protein
LGYSIPWLLTFWLLFPWLLLLRLLLPELLLVWQLLYQLLLPWLLLMFPWRLPTWLNGYCAGGCVFWKKFLMLLNVHFDVFNGSTFEIDLGAFS